MPTNPQFEFACAVCGTLSRHESVDTSSCTYGPRDLDTRPPVPLRTALPTLVRRCPQCGYCATNLMEAGAQVKPVIESEAYRAQLNDEYTPELANRFLCAALIADDRGQRPYAGWSRVHAAWACDDQGDDTSARRCREAAVATFREAREAGIEFIPGGEGEHLLLGELLRRAGRLEKAKTEIDAGLAEGPPPPIARLLEIELQLIAAANTASQTVPAGDPIAETLDTTETQ